MRSSKNPDKSTKFKGAFVALFAVFALFLAGILFPSANPSIPAENIITGNESIPASLSAAVAATQNSGITQNTQIPVIQPGPSVLIQPEVSASQQEKPSAADSAAISPQALPLNPEATQTAGSTDAIQATAAASVPQTQAQTGEAEESAQIISPENLPSGEEESEQLPSLLELFLRSFLSYKALLSREMPFIYGTDIAQDFGSIIEEQEMAPEEIPQEIQLEIKKIQGEKEPSHTVPADGYQVLIYHTHTLEAYRQTDGYTYTEAGRWRTNDQSKNIVHVGDVLQKELGSYGFNVLHDKTNHEKPDLNTAYSRSLATIKNYLKENKSLRVFIDLHRDASSNTNDIVTIDGKRCARVMFVVGMGKSASVKPDWKQNYKLAQAISNKLNAIAPNFARDVRVKEIRSYNQYVSDLCMLIEAGHNANTLEEAENTMPYLAKAISQVIKVQK